MNQKGFTLVEMMIVLAVITTLLVISIPNVAKNNSTIKEKGCQAFIQLVEAQIQAYEMETGEIATTTQQLVTNGYITKETCPDGSSLIIDADGQVTKVE